MVPQNKSAAYKVPISLQGDDVAHVKWRFSMDQSLTPDGSVQSPLSRSVTPTFEEFRVDAREQLFNRGESGPISEVQLAAAEIYRLNGIMIDVDPDQFQESSLTPHVPTDPHEFFNEILSPCLKRNSVLSKAEVRNSGTGFHVILFLEDPPQFHTDAERDRWAGIVKVVQASVPSDSDQPHITAVTRPLGSINSKNGAVVKLLQSGELVSQVEVIEFASGMKKKPFNTLLKTMFGSEKATPCPICGVSGRTLSALGQKGKCYGGCGTVQLSQLYDLVLKPRSEEVNMEVSHGE